MHRMNFNSAGIRNFLGKPNQLQSIPVATQSHIRRKTIIQSEHFMHKSCIEDLIWPFSSNTLPKCGCKKRSKVAKSLIDANHNVIPEDKRVEFKVPC